MHRMAVGQLWLRSLKEYLGWRLTKKINSVFFFFMLTILSGISWCLYGDKRHKFMFCYNIYHCKFTESLRLVKIS